MRRKYISFLVIPSLLVTLLISCVDLPNETISPTWELPLYFPLTDTTFVLEEMIDDSSIVASDDPSSLGLLYYEQENIIDPISVDSSLSLEGFSTSASQVIGSIAIDDVDPITENILVSEWSDYFPGDTVIFLETSTDLTIPFPRVDAFSYLILEDGSLNLKIDNRLPIEIEMRGIIIRNAVGGEIVAEYSTPIVVPINDTVSIPPFDLTGKIIEDSLQYEGIIYTAGSNGISVELPPDAGTRITGTFTNLVVEEVQAVLPEQAPFIQEDVLVFDDSTKIETAIFDAGNFTVTFSNNLDVAINLDIEIENLKKDDGSTYTERVSLDRNESNREISYPDLSEWQIVTLTPGTPTNELSYSAIVSTIPSSSPSTISKDDSINIDINFGDVTLAYVEGIITPVSYDIEETDFDFDLGDIQDTFTYDELTWGNPGIILTLNSSANMEIALDGLITGSSNSSTNTMDFNVELSGGGTEVVDLRDYGFVDFMNSFSDDLPSNFTFSGSALVNPNYVSGSVEKADSITGSVFVEIPLDIGIAGGSFIDTTKVDDIDMSDDDIDAINSFSITLEMTNALPVGISISGWVIDSVGTKLFPFPPSYNENSEIIVPPASVDNNGYVISSAELTQTIELQGDDARLFLKNPKLILDVKMDTPSQNTVKFRNTDSIRMKVYGHLNYTVNPDSD